MPKTRCVVVGTLLAVLSTCVSSLSPATAEPSGVCRGLAGMFASAPAQLDMASLAALATCVTTEMGQRSGSVPPPAPPPSAGPSPGGSAGQSPSQRPWGEWPQPSPWGESSWQGTSWEQ
jgi:hypothetical protein